MLAASTILHFYFDGFIWKVRENATQVNLGIDPRSNSPLSKFDFAHIGRWALLLSGVGLLFIAERRGAATTPPRDAHFVCALALAWPDGHVEWFEGRVDGTLVWPPRGGNGFGYDPMFLPNGHAETFGEMAPAAKHAMSHRADAFRQLVAAVF